jgi:hypothetical protein
MQRRGHVDVPGGPSVMGSADAGAGRETLKYDVHPGGRLLFLGDHPVRAAGEYTLELALVVSRLPDSPNSALLRSGYRCACFPSE